MVVTQPRSASNLHQRARIRAFFNKGVQDLHLQWTANALAILLHSALVLFLAGLLIFTIRSNQTVFKVVVPWVGLCTVVYACFTFLPIFRHDSPYCTPLSSPLWVIYTGTLSMTFRILRWLTAFNCCNDKAWDSFGSLKDDYQRRFFRGLERVAEECAQKSSPEVDHRILLWALQSSRQDHELEQFFAVVPDFYGSRALDDPLAVFKTSIGEKMADALIGLMARTLSSDLLPQSTKQHRIMICNRAMAKASLPINRRTLGRVLYKDWSGLIDSVDFGLLLKKATYCDTFTEYYSQCVVSVIIAEVRQHDGRWFELATNQLRVSRSTLENCLARGDSMLLANCIFISRRTFEAYQEHGWNCDVYSRSKTLQLVSQLDIQDTLPELQHEFCDMWNDLVRNAGNRRSRNLSIYILKHVRHLYFGLHQGTGASPIVFTSSISDRDNALLFPQSYPSCTIARHNRTAKHPNASSASIPVAPPTYTPRMILCDESHNQSVLPLPDNFGVIRGDAHTHTISFGPNINPRSTYVSVPRDPSCLLCGHRTETGSCALGATTCAMARGAHVPSASAFIPLRHGVVLETPAALATYDATLVPTSCSSYVDASAGMQSSDHELCISQCISLSLPARAVLRGYPVKDDRRSAGLLRVADPRHETTGTASSISDVSGAFSASPHSFTATSSSTGCFASADSEDLQNFTDQLVIATPSSSFPIPIMARTVLTYSQSSPTSSTPQSDDILPEARSLANVATPHHHHFTEYHGFPQQEK
jgi:hypothetical protein